MHRARTLIRRALLHVAPPAVYVGEHTLCARPLCGGFLYLDSRDLSLTPAIALNGEWEPEITREFQSRLRPGMHVVDIGSNVGFYSVLAARRVGPKGSVRAFDPNPRMAELLQRSFHANAVAGWAQVTAGAVLDREAEIELGVPAELLGSASILVKADAYRREPVRHFKAKARPLDAWLGADRRVDVLKIDAEGAEPLIWDGARPVMDANPRMLVFIEFAPPMISDIRPPAEFLGQIRAAGFQVEAFDMSVPGGRLGPISDEDLLSRPWTELLLTKG